MAKTQTVPLDPLEEARHHHLYVDPHRTSSQLPEIILGGQDGLVNVLGVILGVAAATSDQRVILAAGFAAAFAESVSMAAVAYTSTLANSEHYQAELERERRHVELIPDLEREELRAIYHAKGIEGELLDSIVDSISGRPEVWVAVMMAEEHGLTPLSRSDALRSALIVGVSAIVGSLIPLVPFLVADIITGIIVAIVVSAITLFVVGYYKAKVTLGHPGKSGLEMLVIGMASAAVGYLIGSLFK